MAAARPRPPSPPPPPVPLQWFSSQGYTQFWIPLQTRVWLMHMLLWQKKVSPSHGAVGTTSRNLPEISFSFSHFFCLLRCSYVRTTKLQLWSTNRKLGWTLDMAALQRRDGPGAAQKPPLRSRREQKVVVPNQPLRHMTGHLSHTQVGMRWTRSSASVEPQEDGPEKVRRGPQSCQQGSRS